MQPSRFKLAAALCLAITSCGEEQQPETDDASSELMCGGESRSRVTTTDYPNQAVGRLLINGSPGCSGSLIAGNKVLTAAHCIGDTATNLIRFQPGFGLTTCGSGPATATATRIVQGRDAPEAPVRGDWAIVTVDQDLSRFGTFDRVIPPAPTFSVNLTGYHGDKFSLCPGREIGCFVRARDEFGGRLFHSCDVQGGASGGPIWRMVGSRAHQFAVQSGHSNPQDPSCSGSNGNNAASALFFAFAPDNTAGIATAKTSAGPSGRLVTYATDKDWTLVGTRSKVSISSGAEWSPWQAYDSGFGGARRIAATNLQDGRQEIFVAKADGTLVTRWETSAGGSLSAWTQMSVPGSVVDVAATGAANTATHLFVVTSGGRVHVSNKIGDANSAWSAWTFIGSNSFFTDLSAVEFAGVRQIFVSTVNGMFTAWGSFANFTSLQAFGGAGNGWLSTSVGLLQDGSVHVQAWNLSAGVLQTRTRALDGSSWTNWTTFGQPTPVNRTSFVELGTGQLPDGREQLFAVADNGEIYSSFQSGGSFSPWTRFYK